MELSKRLKKVAEYVNQNARLADIGSDHAYLPTYLVKQGRIAFAIAGEVVKGPYQSAQETVTKEQLQNNIFVRLGDGLTVIEPHDKIDTVTICGMGGELIAKILEKGHQADKLKHVTRLILQPNMAEKHVRNWLMHHQYAIVAECILMEQDKIYEMIVAQPSHEAVVYTEKQLQFGIYLPTEKSEAFIKKWQSEYVRNEWVLSNLHKSKQDMREKIAYYKNQQIWIKEMIE